VDLDAREGIMTASNGALDTDRLWKDTSGNDRHANLGSGVQWDPLHQSFHFDTNSIAVCPLDISPSSYGELTVEVWFKLSIDHFHGAGDKAYLIGHDNGGYDRAFFASDGRYGGFGQGLGGGGGFAKPGIGYPPQNKWHHGVAVFGRTGSSGASFVALNNKQGNTATARAGEGLPKFQIGGLSVSKGHGMRGLIKRVRIWDTAYSMSQISSLYGEFKKGVVDKPVTTAPPGVSTGDLDKVDGRLAGVEEMLANGTLVTKDEVMGITAALKKVNEVLADVQKQVASGQKDMAAMGARVKKIEDMFIADAVANLVEKTDTHATNFATIKDGLGAAPDKVVGAATSSGKDTTPTIVAEGNDMVISALKGALTFQDEKCGAVDFCTMAETIDKLSAAMEGIADKLP